MSEFGDPCDDVDGSGFEERRPPGVASTRAPDFAKPGRGFQILGQLLAEVRRYEVTAPHACNPSVGLKCSAGSARTSIEREVVEARGIGMLRGIRKPMSSQILLQRREEKQMAPCLLMKFHWGDQC